MHRLRWIFGAALIGGVFAGCGGEDSPYSTPPSETGPEFAHKTADMMKQANAGTMDLKKAQHDAARKK